MIYQILNNLILYKLNMILKLKKLLIKYNHMHHNKKHKINQIMECQKDLILIK